MPRSINPALSGSFAGQKQGKDWYGQGPRRSVSIACGLGAVAMSGLAPGALVSRSIACGVGSATLSGLAPVVFRRIVCGAGSATLTGLAPSVSMGVAANPIDDARRIDWTKAGANIATSRTKYGSTISAYSGTSAAIQNALAAAGDNQYVELGAGTFTLSNALNVGQKNNVTLRGQGMSTILNFTGNSGANWYWGGATCAVTIGGSFIGASDASPPTASQPSGQVRDWTGCGGVAGSYPKGSSVLNVSSTPTGLSAGDVVTLWQDNDDANIPRDGWFVSDKTSAGSDGICWQGAYDDHGAGLLQRSVVTTVSGTQVTIDPPLAHGLFDSALNPQMSWHAAAAFVTGVGIENLRIVTTSLGTHNAVVGISHAKECWLKGVGLVPRYTSYHAGGAVDYGVAIQDAMRIEVRDGWIDTMRGGGIYTTTSYSIATKASSFVKVENMVFNNPESAIVPNIGSMGCVFAYNYERYVGDDSQESGFQPHESGQVFNLFEGNSLNKFWCDFFHGNSMFGTLFRNHLYGWGISLDAYMRYFNMLGNCIAATAVRKSLVTDSTKYDRWDSFGYRMGYPNQNADSTTTSGVAADPLVGSTAFIWGDYTTGFGVQWNSADVPASDAYFPNAVPESETLPASQVYSSAPSFFSISGVGTVAWPPIGPDVSSGDYMGGRAHKLPAQLMYEDASGLIANFDPSMYGS